MPHNQITSEIIIAGQKTMKAKALHYQMMYQTSHVSMDRLKCVQHILCFNPITGISPKLKSSTIISSDSDGLLGMLCLHISNPIATLVQCEGHIFWWMTQQRLIFRSYVSFWLQGRMIQNKSMIGAGHYRWNRCVKMYQAVSHI
jgi:hypothetical protein